MKRNNKKSKVIFVIILILIVIVGAIYLQFLNNNTNNNVNIDKSQLNIFYFNVGQADSSLVLYEDKVILIDAGNVSDGAKIVEFLKANGINKIDYLIGTHIHEDHIGGIANIVDNISVKKIYMPYNVTEDASFYIKVKNCIKDKG